jgi:hypothetical protein
MPMGDLAAPQAFGTGSPGELAQQPSAASLLGQLFGSIQQAPETPPQVVYPTANPLTAITDKDINRGIDIGLGFSGGGLGIKAYHGSPHSFERFDASKIGTGEGAQSYGHGLYFAENEKVAKGYRDKLSPGSHSRAIDEALGNDTSAYPGRMYEVDINAAPEHFLDWDKPLQEQGVWDKLHPNVRNAIDDAMDERMLNPMSDALEEYTGKELYQALKHHDVHEALPAELPGSSWYTGATNEKKHTAAYLHSIGVPGIKYLDKGSRTAPGSQTSNYVVFDDSLVNIMRKYGLLGAPAMGALAAQNYTLPQEGL